MSDKSLILKIDSSVQGEDSVTRALTGYLAEQLREGAELKLLERDLGNNPFPPITAQQLRTVHGSLTPADAEARAQLNLSDSLIEELKKARALIIGAPMYNFGIPATLKAWVDHICRARVTFRYTENGPQGLTGIEEGYIVVASGGTPVGSPADFVSGYLKHILGFIGVKRIHVIDAAGSKRDVEKTLASGRAQIDALLSAAEMDAQPVG